MATLRSGTFAAAVTGRRAGTALVVIGLVLAVLAALIVRNITRQAQLAAAQSTRPIYVVMATQEIPEYTPIPAGAVAIKAFPAAFAPEGAATTIDQVVGKYSTTRITRDQVVLASQVSATRSGSPSGTIPPGRVVFWMPMPELLSQSGGLQPGDRVDILLTITLSGTGANPARGLTTQATIQNAEVFSIGPLVTEQSTSTQPASQGGPSKPGAKLMSVLLDPQDAVIAKYIKDSGGTIDLVLRSKDWQDYVATEPVNADALVDRFRFRVPEQWSAAR